MITQRRPREFDARLDKAFEEWRKKPRPLSKKELADLIGCEYQVITRIEKRVFEKLKGNQKLRGWLL